MIKKCKFCKVEFEAKKRNGRPTGWQQFCQVRCGRSFRKGKPNPEHSRKMKEGFASGRIEKIWLGKEMPEAMRKKMSEARMGVEPWNKNKPFPQMKGNKYAFVGDRAKRNTLSWRARQIVGERKNCEMCGVKDTKRNLVVHHKDEQPSNNNRSNLQVLCRSCHINHHRKTLLKGQRKYHVKNNRNKILEIT